MATSEEWDKQKKEGLLFWSKSQIKDGAGIGPLPGKGEYIVVEDKGKTKFVVPDGRVREGGGPTRATTLPTDPVERKKYPVATGLLDYFPDALVAVAYLSYTANNQHNPGKSLQWDRTKSSDEDDTMIRHYLQRGSLDTDGIRHSVKVAWRALALLQKEIEGESK